MNYPNDKAIAMSSRPSGPFRIEQASVPFHPLPAPLPCAFSTWRRIVQNSGSFELIPTLPPTPPQATEPPLLQLTFGRSVHHYPLALIR